MKINNLIILIWLPILGYSQTMYEVKDQKFKLIADSIIDSHTDSNFRKGIRYSRTWECYYDTSDMNSKILTEFKPVKGVKVCYGFFDACNQSYSFMTKTFGMGELEIKFDFRFRIVELPKFELMKKVVEIHYKCFISYDTAQKIAIKNSKPKSRKTWTNRLVYDLVTNNVYWLVKRESGFRNGIIETIKIDAINQQIIEKTELPYFRKGLFKALMDCIFKVP